MLSQQERNSTQKEEVGCKKAMVSQGVDEKNNLIALNNTDCEMLMIITKEGRFISIKKMELKYYPTIL